MSSFSRTACSVDVVIVNWNSQSLLRECLAALDRSTIADRLNVFIVDNASVDASAEVLSADRVRLEVIRNNVNRGFGAACNQGAKKGAAPLILLVNPDVRVTPHSVEHTAKFLTEPANSSVGIAGIKLLDVNGRIQRSCARRPTVATLLLRTMFLDRLCPALVPPHFLAQRDHCDTRPVDQVMGAFLMIRRTLFEKIGGFDERFFLYYEDVDLCVQAQELGSRVMYFTGAEAEHLGMGTTAAIRDRRLFYEARSRVAYTAKHQGRVAATSLSIFIGVIELPIRVVYATTWVSPREGWVMFRGAALFWRNLVDLWRNLGTRR
jgi:GT2 family glycosyltransferase